MLGSSHIRHAEIGLWADTCRTTSRVCEYGVDPLRLSGALAGAGFRILGYNDVGRRDCFHDRPDDCVAHPREWAMDLDV